MPGSSSRVCILGAGPAGLVAALALAYKGIETTVIDKSVFPRPKICGDGISGKLLNALNLIDPGLPRELCRQDYVTPSSGVRFVSPSGKHVTISLKTRQENYAPGIVCPREKLDGFLAGKIRDHPLVTFIEGLRISRIDRSSGALILIDPSGETRHVTSLLLIATGNEIPVGLQPMEVPSSHPGDGLGIRAYFEGIEIQGNENAIEIHFLKELLPWYFWIFPFGKNSANAGLGLPIGKIRKERIRLKDLFWDVIQRYPHLRERFRDARMQGKLLASSLRIYCGRTSISGERFMLLGDAARLVDPFTGEGIGNAAYSGLKAAMVAIECLEKKDCSAAATGNYDRLVYDGLGKELDLSLRLREFAHNPALLNLVIGRASQSIKIRKIIEEMLYDLNTKGKLGEHLFYLKLLLRI